MNKFQIGDRVSIREDSKEWKDAHGKIGTVTMVRCSNKEYLYFVSMDYFPANPGHLLGEKSLQFHYD